MIRVQYEDFDAASLTRALRARTHGRAGAVLAFTGLVRDVAPGSATRSLTLEHYPGMCEREIAAICAEACARWAVLDYCVVHRVGELQLGEQIVFVAVASIHRADAFRACEYVIDALKTRAPLWKRETLDSGESFWVQRQGADAGADAEANTAKEAKTSR